MILGSPGKDTIEGGSGRRCDPGLANDDTYVFNNGYGTDKFVDYHGKENLDFSGATNGLDPVACSSAGSLLASCSLPMPAQVNHLAVDVWASDRARQDSAPAMMISRSQTCPTTSSTSRMPAEPIPTISISTQRSRARTRRCERRHRRQRRRRRRNPAGRGFRRATTSTCIPRPSW